MFYLQTLPGHISHKNKNELQLFIVLKTETMKNNTLVTFSYILILSTISLLGLQKQVLGLQGHQCWSVSRAREMLCCLFVIWCKQLSFVIFGQFPINTLFCALSLQHLPLTFTIDPSRSLCAEGRIPDLHNYGRKRTAVFCMSLLHNSSALQCIIQGN